MGKERTKLQGYRNVVTLGLVSLFTDISTEMVLSLYPAYLVKYLGSSKAVLGLIEGLSEAVAYATRPLSGALSDKLRRRKALATMGYLISSLAKPLLAFSRSWPEVLAVRLGDRLGKGLRTAPRDALLSQSVRRRDVGKAFGLHRTLDQLGAIIGPLLAMVLLPGLGIRGIFLTSLLPGLLAVILLASLVSEEGAGGRISGERQVQGAWLRGLSVVLTPLLPLYLASYTFSFVLIRASELGVPLGLIPLVYAILNLSHALIGLPVGALMDRAGGRAALSLGYAAFMGASALAALGPREHLTALAIAALYGLYVGVFDTVPRALISLHAPLTERGRAYGLYYLVVGGASLIGNSVFGYLWSTRGSLTAFTYSISLSAASLILLIMFRPACTRGSRPWRPRSPTQAPP